MPAPEHTGVLRKRRDDVLDSLRLACLRIDPGDVHPITADEADAQHDLCHARHGRALIALRAVLDEAVAKRAPLVEIIPGKGSGALKKHVLRFLDQKEIKALYHRVEKDSDNFGRIFVHFRWK